MERLSHKAKVRINLTAKAQRLGLCPNRHDVMVQMEQSLMNEVVALYETAGTTRKLHWIECLNEFMTQARRELSKAPTGSRSFDFNIETSHRYTDVHVEIEELFEKQTLVFSLAGRNRQVA